MRRALVVAGPTAAGKSDVALEVAAALGATVVSADAMQVYRGMNVGTGKLTMEARRGVPHLGIDVRDPHEPFDAADFVTLATAALDAGPVVVCGGTSLYLRALARGLVEAPSAGPALRAEVESIADLHGALAEVDPALAARLHPHDRVRLLRGIEVFRVTGQRLSELQAEHAQKPDRVDLVGVWLDRDDLEARIDARVEQMMRRGYVDEVRGLLDSGVDRQLKPMRSLGYRHLADHLLDGLELHEAVRRTARDTRRFAHKQRTWRKALGLPVAGPEDAVRVMLNAARSGSG